MPHKIKGRAIIATKILVNIDFENFPIEEIIILIYEI